MLTQTPFSRVLLIAAGLTALSSGAFAQSSGVCKAKAGGYAKLVMAQTVRLGAARFPGVAQSLGSGIADPFRGREIVRTLAAGSCLACHSAPSLGDKAQQGNIGPSLEGVAHRYDEAQLRQILMNARDVFPNTIMPAFYQAAGLNRVADQGKDVLTGQDIEDVVSFLKTMK